MHQQIIASELSQLGFTTQTTETGVLVSLNRPISRMEVETALEQTIEGVTFTTYQVHRNTIHVITEE
jgi:hypothetical protein